MTLLVDSSVWIDYFNGKITWQTDFLDQALGSEPIIVGDLILAEILQGFRSDSEFNTARNALSRFPLVQLVNPDLAIKSAIHYRFLRGRGITVRKTIDCLIATYCLDRGVTLLHADRDYDHFERHLGLSVQRPN